MKILVLNCGSSSLKYQLIDMDGEIVLAKGLVDRIGIDNSVLEHEPMNQEEVEIKDEISDHNVAIKMVIDALLDQEHGVIDDMDEIHAVGHRIVHGGEQFSESVLIDDEVYEGIEDVKDLAPLHNPANLLGVRVSRELMPETPDVAVFDTAFHQSMPETSYVYALPYEWYEEHQVRRYGFHGTSHKYVTQRAAEMLDKSVEDLKVISCHLGNGASVAAIDGGQVIDTSMGLTPLEGLVMGTRCGDIDPAIIPFMMEKEDLEADEINEILNEESGMYGISKVSRDFRDIEDAAAEGHEKAQLAVDVYCQRVKKYIGAYTAELGGLDVIIFTAGAGENGSEVREQILTGLEYLGIEVDQDKNSVRGEEQIISSTDSDVTAMVVPTNEELMIARDTERIVAQ
ncbi:MAG: acetate kinase [Bacillota bacterium]